MNDGLQIYNQTIVIKLQIHSFKIYSYSILKIIRIYQLPWNLSFNSWALMERTVYLQFFS